MGLRLLIHLLPVFFITLPLVQNEIWTVFSMPFFIINPLTLLALCLHLTALNPLSCLSEPLACMAAVLSSSIYPNSSANYLYFWCHLSHLCALLCEGMSLPTLLLLQDSSRCYNWKLFNKCFWIKHWYLGWLQYVRINKIDDMASMIIYSFTSWKPINLYL